MQTLKTVEDMFNRTYVASSVLKQVKKGELSARNIRKLKKQPGAVYLPMLYIPVGGQEFIEFGMIEEGVTPARFAEEKYLQLCFVLPSGKEQEFSNFVEELDDKFYDGELTQRTVFSKLENYLKSL